MGGRGSSSGLTNPHSGNTSSTTSVTPLNATDALQKYQTGFAGNNNAYERINKNLREGKKLSKKDEAISQGLERGMKSGEMETVFRGLGRTGHEQFLKAGKMGIVQDKSFSSTTRDPKIANNFTKKGGWQAAILVHPDAKRMDVNKVLGKKSEFREEKEVLLNKGTKYRVTGIDRKNKVVSLQALP